MVTNMYSQCTMYNTNPISHSYSFHGKSITLVTSRKHLCNVGLASHNTNPTKYSFEATLVMHYIFRLHYMQYSQIKEIVMYITRIQGKSCITTIHSIYIHAFESHHNAKEPSHDILLSLLVQCGSELSYPHSY